MMAPACAMPSKLLSCGDKGKVGSLAGTFRESGSMAFDWHGGEVTRTTQITTSYRNTQNVRRFFKAECGDGFKFDRAFMAWLR